MKKFECKECYIAPCIINVGDDTNRLPGMCPYGVSGVIWHEVKEETTTNCSQLVTDCNQLPHWYFAGEWMYDSVKREYAIVKKEESYSWYIDNIANGRIKQARKRPFNADEMKALVGKVIEDGDNALFVTVYYGKEECISAGCVADFDGSDLMRCSCDGKPCYVLEHLENGEWVE